MSLKATDRMLQGGWVWIGSRPLWPPSPDLQTGSFRDFSRKKHACRGDRGNAFAAADETKPLIGCGLYRDAVLGDSQHLGHCTRHLVAVWPNHRFLAYERDINIGNPAAAGTHHLRRMLDKDT